MSTWDEQLAATYLYRCDICGTEATMTGADAHGAGWDGLPYMTGYTCCPRCPSFVALMAASADDERVRQWAREDDVAP